ncbi:hypothetical protein ACJX0J_007482, partial [Zea mays]
WFTDIKYIVYMQIVKVQDHPNLNLQAYECLIIEEWRFSCAYLSLLHGLSHESGVPFLFILILTSQQQQMASQVIASLMSPADMDLWIPAAICITWKKLNVKNSIITTTFSYNIQPNKSYKGSDLQEWKKEQIYDIMIIIALENITKGFYINMMNTEQQIIMVIYVFPTEEANDNLSTFVLGTNVILSVSTREFITRFIGYSG